MTESSERADGGPAFPVAMDADNPGYTEFGMTLRDYFAAKAMVAILSLPQRNHLAFVIDESKPGEINTQLDGPRLAKNAYIVADAMLAARQKGANGG